MRFLDDVISDFTQILRTFANATQAPQQTRQPIFERWNFETVADTPIEGAPFFSRGWTTLVALSSLERFVSAYAIDNLPHYLFSTYVYFLGRAEIKQVTEQAK